MSDKNEALAAVAAMDAIGPHITDRAYREHAETCIAYVRTLAHPAKAGGDVGECNCASGRGAEHCIVHADNSVLPELDKALAPSAVVPVESSQEEK